MDRTLSKDLYDHHGRSPLLSHSNIVRILIFTVVNLILFTAINTFWQYLATGSWYDFSPQAYFRNLTLPLGQSLLPPLSVVSYPWMILVMGLLLAAAILVPVLMVVLYRTFIAGLFLLVVVIIGHAPALSIALAIGCTIAARTPLRSDAPFLALLLGLLPAGIYLYFFGISDAQLAEVLPLHRWVIAGPMAVAILAAILMGAGVLGLAKLTHFRAGVFWPFLLVLLIGPATIFYTFIGDDELQYALVLDGLAPGDQIFHPVTLNTWKNQHQILSDDPARLETEISQDLKEKRGALIKKCEHFLRRHKNSHRASSVLWIRAQCRSLQLDYPALLEDTVRYSAAYIVPASAGLWQELAENYSTSPQAALARARLGELSLRQAKVEPAIKYLSAAEEGLKTYLQTRPSYPGRATELFRPGPSQPNRSYYAETLFRTQRLLWMIERNEVRNNPAAADALAALMNEDPRKESYADRMGKLVSRYEHTPLGDNLKLAVAVSIQDPYQQAEMLIWLAKNERTDSAVEANYYLGMLTMQTARARALPLIPELKSSKEYFQTVIAAPPNPWQPLVENYLLRVGEADSVSQEQP
jgi:hypothetical protein